MRLTGIIRQHSLKFSFTLVLILAEALLMLLFPLFIGKAIDGVMHGSDDGVMQLSFIGLAVLIVGVGRRIFDSRFYAGIYQRISPSILSRIGPGKSSVKSARLGMVRELIEFLEHDFPELMNACITLFGVVIMLAILNLNVFYGSLIVTSIIFVIYLLSRVKTMDYNKASNDELENQVEVLTTNDDQALATHLKKMMKWNIKLSDLEAFNFSLSWLVLLGFMLAAILIAADDGMIQYGALFSLIMYVFQYMENVLNLPFFYQNWLRLKEIMERIETD